MTDLAIIVPVLDRPQNVAPLMESVARGTPEPHRLLFVATEGDRPELQELERAGADFLVTPPARSTWAKKINDGYAATVEPWLFTGADDLDFGFRPGWFSRALVWAAESTGVIGTNDLNNQRTMTGLHSTHSLVRRGYVDRWGTVDGPGAVCELYGHDYGDDELVATAMARGAYVHAFDAIVRHVRPAQADEDDTYKLGRAQSAGGRRLFQSRKRLWASVPNVSSPTRAAVVTACYGGVDTRLHPQAEQDIAVEWFCFTDQEGLDVPAPWRVVVRLAEHEDPRQAAAVHKMRPEVEGHTDVVWIDASMEVTSPTFVREALDARHGGVAVWRHPRRQCVYQEAAALEVECPGKYDAARVAAQVDAYRKAGYPSKAGLFACGTVAWDLADEKARALGRRWWDEAARWATIDQIAFPVVCAELGVKPGVFPVKQIEGTNRRDGSLRNRWLAIHPHRIEEPCAVSPPMTTSPVTASVSVVIPFASEDVDRLKAYGFVLGWYRRHFPAWEIVVCTMEGPWSKGRALADGVARASGDVLVIADADSVASAEAFCEAVGRVAGGAGWVVPHKLVWRLNGAATRRIYEGAELPVKVAQRDLARHAYVGTVGGGVTVLSREAWRESGGVDPRFVGWAGEDLSWGRALETLCGPLTRLDAPLVHLWHPPEVKGSHPRGTAETEALAGRYKQAKGDRAAMRALVDEHAAVTV